MQLNKLTKKERKKLLNDMKIFGHFESDEIDTFIEEKYLNKKLIIEIGKCIFDVKINLNHSNHSNDYNKIVYEYITNVDDIQLLIRHKMNLEIRSNKIYINHFKKLAENNNIVIDDNKILSLVLKWYNSLYDLAGILEYPCLSVFTNIKLCSNQNFVFNFDHDEQIYNLMINF